MPGKKGELRKCRFERAQRTPHLLDGVQYRTIKTQLEMVRRRRAKVGKWVGLPRHIFKDGTARPGPNYSLHQNTDFEEESWSAANHVTGLDVTPCYPRAAARRGFMWLELSTSPSCDIKSCASSTTSRRPCSGSSRTR